MSKLIRRYLGGDATSNLFLDTLKSLTEGLTGVASSDRKDLFLSLGHIFQRLRAGQFLQTLMNEWNQFRNKGRIKDDYVESEQHKACLQEMLDFLDKDSPEEIRFSFLKRLFLSAATEKVKTRDSVLPQQYMRICRGLSSGEVLILQAAYSIAKKGGYENDSSARQWLQIIANESGLELSELVDIHDRTLEEKQLLVPRRHGDRSGVILGKYYRLTNLAFEICEFISAYEERDNTSPVSSKDTPRPDHQADQP
jgi:hypothetical protein